MSLLLSTPPEGSQFYPNALRAVALSSAVSRSLHELAVKVNNLISFHFPFSALQRQTNNGQATLPLMHHYGSLYIDIFLCFVAKL